MTLIQQLQAAELAQDFVTAADLINRLGGWNQVQTWRQSLKLANGTEPHRGSGRSLQTLITGD